VPRSERKIFSKGVFLGRNLVKAVGLLLQKKIFFRDFA
jgi:hypothetical protein